MSMTHEIPQVEAILHYRDVKATVQWSEEDACWVGRTINTPNAQIAFHTDTLDEIRQEFKEAVDCTIECLEEAGHTLQIVHHEER